MNDYYCKNCNNLVGKWYDEHKYYYGLHYCNLINSKKFNSINFLDCKNCDKFIGIVCFNVCKNCFKKNSIIGEENLFNWFLKYKKIINSNFTCKICNEEKYRWQYWYFKELTFYK